MTSEQSFVRPTLDCLEVLGVKRPQIDVQLDKVDHPLIEKAQMIPALVGCNEAEPILSVHDRRWLKVKVHDLRGGVTIVDSSEEYAHICENQSFWLGLAGKRQGDSAQRDFYQNLPADTSAYLPRNLDWKRWYAEQAYAAQQVTQRLFRKGAWLSLSMGKAFCFPLGESLIWVQVRMMESGLVYLALGARGLSDPKTYALLMSSFPDIPGDDWLPEPDGVADLKVDSGEVIYSAILSTEGQGALFEEADRLEWSAEL